MFYPIFRKLLIFLTLSSFAFANEGGGGEEGGGAKEVKEIKSSEESFSVVQARVQGLEAKVHSGEEEIQKLIVEKQHTTNPEKLNEVIKHLVTLHKDLASTIKEYDQQRALLKYRYPEKGQAEKREYERIELKSIEDMETQMSLTSSVKQTLKKVRIQYPDQDKKESKKNPENEKKINDATSQPSLVDPVILKK